MRCPPRPDAARTVRPRQFIGVDWSGARDPARAAAHIRVAVVREGGLREVHGGLTREAVADLLIEAVLVEPETAIGLDFCFSVPAWYATERGWSSVGEVWRWAAAWARSGADPAALDAPFWGPRVRPSPEWAPERALRATEREVSRAGAQARSVFQLTGAGSVGAQSLHGMPMLMRLCDVGVAVWPFDPPRLPVAVEVFPRRMARDLAPTAEGLSGDVFRRAVVEHLPDAAVGGFRRMLADDQDAFDAAIAAWTLHQAGEQIGALAGPRDPREALEGRIFVPEAV